jgi:uncharacterized protein DUF3305
VNPTALVRIPVGVLVERRKASSPWIDFGWQPVGVLVGEPAAAPWTVLSSDAETTTFYAGKATVEFYRTETGNYRDNISSGAPALWVILRPTGAEPPYEVVAVTADPAEGEAATEAGNNLVEAVPMPEVVRDTLEVFIAEHHVERPFFKRKRDRTDPEVLGRRAGGSENDE